MQSMPSRRNNNACNLLHVYKHVWTHLVCTNATSVSNFTKIKPYTNLNTRAVWFLVNCFHSQKLKEREKKKRNVIVVRWKIWAREEKISANGFFEYACDECVHKCVRVIYRNSSAVTNERATYLYNTRDPWTLEIMYHILV